MSTIKHALHQRIPLFTLVILLCMATACRNADTTWQQIADSGTIRIGVDPSYPPFEALEGDRLVGFDIALGEEIAAELGVAVEWDIIGYDGLYDALLTKRVDVLLSALIIDERRTQEFAYSEPYFNVGQLLISRGQTPIQNKNGLDGGIVSAELGAEGHVVATQWQRTVDDLDIATFGTAAAALQAVVAGEADAAIVDSVSGYLFVANDATLTIAEDPVTVEPFAIVTRHDDTTLRGNLDDVLEKLTKNGVLDAIQHEWFGVPE